MGIKLRFLLVLMLAATLPDVQNARMVTSRFLHWQFALPQALVIMLAAFDGMRFGLVTGPLP